MEPVEVTQNVNIKCLCNLHFEFKDIPLITCSSCKLIQHAPCMKFFEFEPPADYKCLVCTTGSEQSDDGKELWLIRYISDNHFLFDRQKNSWMVYFLRMYGTLGLLLNVFLKFYQDVNKNISNHFLKFE